MDQSRITELINKSEITSAVNSYFRALDEKNFDPAHYASIFTPQAQVTRPNGGSLIGPEAISASHEKSFTRFEGSQHLVAGHDIALEAGTAKVRAHVSLGTSGSNGIPEDLAAFGAQPVGIVAGRREQLSGGVGADAEHSEQDTDDF